MIGCQTPPSKLLCNCQKRLRAGQKVAVLFVRECAGILCAVGCCTMWI
jgi:hypothetical protein